MLAVGRHSYSERRAEVARCGRWKRREPDGRDKADIAVRSLVVSACRSISHLGFAERKAGGVGGRA